MFGIFALENLSQGLLKALDIRVLESKTVLKIWWRLFLKYLDIYIVAEVGSGLEKPIKNSRERVQKWYRGVVLSISLLSILRAIEILFKGSDRATNAWFLREQLWLLIKSMAII